MPYGLADKVSCILDALCKCNFHKQTSNLYSIAAEKNMWIEDKVTCTFIYKHKYPLEQLENKYWYFFPQKFLKSDYKHQRYVDIWEI